MKNCRKYLKFVSVCAAGVVNLPAQTRIINPQEKLNSLVAGCASDNLEHKPGSH